jgi:hypothetical protein
MKLDDLLKKEGMSPLEKKTSTKVSPVASERRRERPWLQTAEGLAVPTATDGELAYVQRPIETYGKHTDNIRKMDGQPTEIVIVEPTDNLRTTTGSRNLRNAKPTDTPTDNGRIIYGKPTEISSLVGFQRRTFFALAQQAKEFGFSDDNGNRITPAINGNTFAQQCLQKPYKQVKDVIYELKVSKFLSVYKIKNGRGGFVQFLLQKALYQAFLLNESSGKPTDNIRKTYGKPTDKPTDTPTEMVSSSSRDLLIKESTTTQAVDALSHIDLGLVQTFGITTSVLARCIELYPMLKPEQLEVLVFRFAEFARDPKNKVQNARGFFISLAEQASKGQVPLDHIETSDDRLMRLFVERQKEAKACHAEAERAAQNFECEAWLESLTPEMKLTLVPETAILKAGTAAHAAMLKSHFAQNVWPQRRTEILQQEAGL